MKKMLLFSLFLLVGSKAQSQFTNAVNFGSPNSRNDFVIDVKIDNSSNYYVAGTYATDTIDGVEVEQPLPNFQGPINGFFIAKYDANNQLQYMKTLIGQDQGGTDGTAISNGAIEVNDQGELYFACGYDDKVTLDGQTLVTQYNTFGETSMCIGKLDASGNLIWFKNAETKKARVGDLLLKGDSLYVGGLFKQQIYFDNNISSFVGGGDNDGFLVTLNESNGVTQHLEVMENGYIDYLQPTANGLVASGTFGDYGQHPNDVLFSNGTSLTPVWSANQLNRSNGFLISYTDQKSINYIKHIEGNTDKQDFVIVNNKIWFTANNFDYFKMDNDSIPGQKHLLIQLNLSDGSFVTAKECSRYMGRITADTTTNKIVTALRGSGNLEYEGALLSSNPKLAVLVIDDSGVLTDSIFREGYSINYHKAIFALNNQVVMGGGLTGIPNFSDSIALDNGLFLDSDDGIFQDGWYALYRLDGANPMHISETNVLAIQVYPNPFTEGVVFGRRIEKAQVFDIRGNLVKEGLNCQGLQLSDLPKGVFVLKIQQGSQWSMKKLVKH